MSTNHGLPRPALLLLGAVLGLGNAPAGRGADHQSVLTDSPFGQPAAAPAATSASVEFRGAVLEGKVWLVNLHQPATKKSHWLTIGGEVDGLLVKGYDETTGRLSIMQAGRPLSLVLKQSRVALQGDNTPLKLLGPAERVSETAQPNLPDHLRDLPPEARKLLEEARRRRAIRWPEMAAEGTAPAARP